VNRREFLWSLMAIPLGWKALFRKEMEELSVEDPIQEGESFQWVQGIPLEPDEPGTFPGLDKIINTGREDDGLKCEDPECPHCEGGLLLPDWVADELKSGKASFERVVGVPLLSEFDSGPPILSDMYKIWNISYGLWLSEKEGGELSWWVWNEDEWQEFTVNVLPKWLEKELIVHGYVPSVEMDSTRVGGGDYFIDAYVYLWSGDVCTPPPVSDYSFESRPMYVRCKDGKVIYCPDVSVPDPQWLPSDIWPARDENLKIVWEPA
jgi:hypothetical protein